MRTQWLALLALATNALAWKPTIGQTWQIVLDSRINVNAPLVPDVDIFDIDLASHTALDIVALKKLGKRVICYFSAGTSELDRAESEPDYKILQQYEGNVLEDWPEEHYIDIREAAVRQVMADRIAIAASKGCDAVDPDNVDAYEANNGLPGGLKDTDAIDYVKFLAEKASANGLSIALKNAGKIAHSVINVVDFSVQEECGEQNDCKVFAIFNENGKPVFNIEYNSDCPGAAGFSSVIKTMGLSGFVQFCDGTTATTEVVPDDYDSSQDDFFAPAPGYTAPTVGGTAVTSEPTAETTSANTGGSTAATHRPRKTSGHYRDSRRRIEH